MHDGPYWIKQTATDGSQGYSIQDLPEEFGVTLSTNSAGGDTNIYSMTLPAGEHFNFWGLRELAGCGVDELTHYQSIEPGDTVSWLLTPPVNYYSQFEEPQLRPLGHYFAPLRFYYTEESGTQPEAPLPVFGHFAATNETPLILCAIGQPTTICGWARLGIANGYSEKRAYLGQYFDKAYKANPDGTRSTNETGVLSPYGEFFPTEPGKAFLTTKPDGVSTNVGECVVDVIKLVLDKNHDGIIDLSFNGADATSQASPMRFWVNNGWCDQNGVDRLNYGFTNYADAMINWPRDLENLARLWICGVPALTNAGYQVTLNWQNVSGTPAVNLFRSVETNGGTGYLTDSNVAAAQTDFQIPNGSGLVFAQIQTGTPFTFPANFFTNNANKYFLFEGAGIGSGQLTMTISQNGNTIAQTGVWLDLHDIKDFYEQAYATNVTSEKPPSSLVSDFSVIQTATSPAPDETKQIITFIHGINNTLTDYQLTTRTIFKRLYWANYHGRFASFRWPCAYLPWNTPNPFQYNLGEYYAFKSATALKNYLNYLRNNRPDLAGYAIDLYAHSQGNVVTSEAILQGAPFDNYILTQGAFPAHCYDTNAPFLQKLLDAETNSVNAVQTPFYPVDGGYHGYCSLIHGNLINFYNTNDFALASGVTAGLQSNWEEDQRTQKPEAFVGGPSYVYNPSNHITTGYYTLGSGYTVTDLQEIKALVARSRSRAVGAQGGLHGAIGGETDLLEEFGFGNTRPEHSAQFTRPIQTAKPYWDEVVRTFNPATP